MNGLFYDLEIGDIVIGNNGSFVKTIIDSQNCALIATSQVCRITKPEVGEQLVSKMFNQHSTSVEALISAAKRAVENDGGKNVIIEVTNEGQLQFKADYNV